MSRSGVVMSGRSWVLDFCEAVRHGDADEKLFFAVIKCFFIRKSLCVKCFFWLYFCIEMNQEKKVIG